MSFSVFFCHLALSIPLSTLRYPFSVFFHDKICNFHHFFFWIDRNRLVVSQPFAVLKRLNPNPALVIDEHTFSVRNVHSWLFWIESMFAVVHTIIAFDCRFRSLNHRLNSVFADLNLSQAEKVVKTASALQVFNQCVSLLCSVPLTNKFFVVWPNKLSCFPQKVDITKLISFESFKK